MKFYVGYNLWECESCSHVRPAHIPTHVHHAPSDRILSHLRCLRQIVLTGCFCATAEEAQEADYESEIQNLPGAPPSAPVRDQAVGGYHLLLQPPASRLPLQLPPAHLPQTFFFFCTVLGDRFVLVYEINLCVLQRKQKVSIFTGLCGYCGPASTRTCQGLHRVFIAEKLQCGLRHSSCKPPGKRSERKMLKEDWGMRTESQHWHVAAWQRARCGQWRCIIGRARSVRRWPTLCHRSDPLPPTAPE